MVKNRISDEHVIKIIDYYQSLGEPEITKELLIEIRQKVYPYGVFEIKQCLINYLDLINFLNNLR